MRRGPKPAKSKEAKRPAPPKLSKDDGERVRDLEKGLADSFQREDETSKRLAQALGQLQTRDRELTEALDQQTATSEILRVISSSATNLQLVLDTVAQSAARLCGANDAQIFRVEGDAMRRVARFGSLATLDVVPLTRSWVASRSVIDRQVVHVLDRAVEVETKFPEGFDAQRRIGHRTTLAVPLLRERDVIGSIFIARTEVRPFSDTQIGLLQTFADQAVIAIENVRLFTELQEKNQALSEALEQQTATGEILRAISSSPTDAQPVFEAIVRSAVRLCNARFANVFRLEGDLVHLVAHHNVPFEALEHFRRTFPQPLSQGGTLTAQAMRQGTVVHIQDVEAQSDVATPVRALTRSAGYRSVLAVPILRPGNVVGAIGVGRSDVTGAPWPFSDKEVALLQTFADQAVIAIENVRLFTELQEKNSALTTAHAQVSEALDRQTATSEILRVISHSLTDVQPVFDTIVRSATLLCGGVHGVVLRYDSDLMHLVIQHGFPPESLEQLRQLFPCPPSRDLIGGRAIIERRIVHIPDLASDPAAPSNSVTIARIGGYRSLLAVPMMRGRDPIGCIVVSRGQAAFSDTQIELVKTFAAQAVIAIENVRLFKELEVANRELAAASQHKSEFLANMSHELRTPLNAIIGFSEVLSEKMFGELNEKQDEYLKDINASGTHLLSLINDILDLSKIEAGRMELELTDFDLPQAIENALTLVRERAGRRGIALAHTMDQRLGEIRGDERKVKQVLLNLLSNALKFTPEGGRVEVRAGMVDGMAEISVTDTGVGIAPEDQEAIFEEFRQVGTAEKKVEGTGLGLALSRKFVELHGGRIWVTSEVGAGSTFTFTIPARRGE